MSEQHDETTAPGQETADPSEHTGDPQGGPTQTDGTTEGDGGDGTSEGSPVVGGQPTPDEEAPGYGEPTTTEGEGAQEGAPEPTTVGDLQEGADEHPVSSTPKLGDADQGEGSPAAGGPAVQQAGETEPREQMNRADERGEPNTRGAGQGDGTVWHDPETGEHAPVPGEPPAEVDEDRLVIVLGPARIWLDGIGLDPRARVLTPTNAPTVAPSETTVDDDSGQFDGWFCIRTDPYPCPAEGCGFVANFATAAHMIIVWERIDAQTLLVTADRCKRVGRNPRVIEYEDEFGPAISWEQWLERGRPVHALGPPPDDWPDGMRL
jgi:hypothetical protein